MATNTGATVYTCTTVFTCTLCHVIVEHTRVLTPHVGSLNGPSSLGLGVDRDITRSVASALSAAWDMGVLIALSGLKSLCGALC